MNPSPKILLVLLGLLTIGLVPPPSGVPAQAWRYTGEGWQALADTSGMEQVAPPRQAFLLGRTLHLRLARGRAALLDESGAPFWQSPAEWEVRQAAFSDLNRDGQTELALLVWRAFEPWPIDRYLPHGGRIDSFHDAAGRSCHLILIGQPSGSHAGEGRLREVWAGSALAEPLLAFSAVDLDGDGWQELAALEGAYDAEPGAAAQSLTAWEWNGFGFTLLARVESSCQSAVFGCQLSVLGYQLSAIGSQLSVLSYR